MTIALSLIAAILLDGLLGEPRRAHPLVGFARFATWVEARMYSPRRTCGIVSWCVTVVPLVAASWWIGHALDRLLPWVGTVFGVGMAYLAIGLRSLGEHARPVATVLDHGDLEAARIAVGRIVGRDTAGLDARQVALAATESVLENGNDAVFGVLFWFAVAGAPGAVLYRLANTLDAMWGHHTSRYEAFGWAAARMDDVLNWVPARLAAATYALCGDGRRALYCWRTQAPAWSSPNAGPVMAAGAGALGVTLGGPRSYDGVWEPRPVLGEGDLASARSIRQALRLVRRAVAVWLIVAVLGSLAVWSVAHA